jgi:hypothetical protein
MHRRFYLCSRLSDQLLLLIQNQLIISTTSLGRAANFCCRRESDFCLFQGFALKSDGALISSQKNIHSIYFLRVGRDLKLRFAPADIERGSLIC